MSYDTKGRKTKMHICELQNHTIFYFHMCVFNRMIVISFYWNLDSTGCSQVWYRKILFMVPQTSIKEFSGL